VFDHPVTPEFYEVASKAANLPLQHVGAEFLVQDLRVYCSYASSLFDLERLTGYYRKLHDRDFLDIAQDSILHHIYNHGDHELFNLVMSTSSHSDVRSYSRIFTVTFVTADLTSLGTILERVARRKCDHEFREAFERTLKNE
jgi:hypothetical protein